MFFLRMFPSGAIFLIGEIDLYICLIGVVDVKYLLLCLILPGSNKPYSRIFVDFGSISLVGDIYHEICLVFMVDYIYLYISLIGMIDGVDLLRPYNGCGGQYQQ